MCFIQQFQVLVMLLEEELKSVQQVLLDNWPHFLQETSNKPIQSRRLVSGYFVHNS